ncbi:ROK family protein [Arthrobacter sp. H16F315]|uniref:ROK family protein n=1 Tax=Arthrobacter sp. H16F315 TaxID=2955314 RepID=UPI002097C667|nr:ROK family protein [Arthrobacter sp. H16F315]MDD1475552.1 ROK family protein [Arthrobacter sp. H16F315]
MATPSSGLTGGPATAGATGCLETEVSQSSLFSLAGLESGDAVELEHALRNTAGTATATEVARQLEFLAIALRNTVNIFNPEAIVLDGFLGILHALAPGTLEELIRFQALDGPAEEVKIHRSALGPDLMMIGAAELAFARFLADPASVGILPAPNPLKG